MVTTERPIPLGKSRILQGLGIDAATIILTQNGFNKSYFDAVSELRSYLKAVGYHDYSAQHQEPGHKVTREIFLVTKDSLLRSMASLYRPRTKNGDPRIWFGNAIRQYAKAGDELAITVIDGTMYVINTSDRAITRSLTDTRSPFHEIFNGRPGRGDFVDALDDIELGDEDEKFAEGSWKRSWHLKRERNRKLVEKKKEEFIAKHGRLHCEVCNDDLVDKYGATVAEACFDAHHEAIAVKEMVEGHESTVDDLKILCANCHRAEHRRMKLAESGG